MFSFHRLFALEKESLCGCILREQLALVQTVASMPLFVTFNIMLNLYGAQFSNYKMGILAVLTSHGLVLWSLIV